MRIATILLLAILCLGAAGAEAGPGAAPALPSPAARVTYLANSGFLVAVDGKKILIDALFSGFSGYDIMPKELQRKAGLAEAPFDAIDLILVTHAHADHMNATLAAKHLSSDATAILLCPPPVAGQYGLAGFGDRVIGMEAGDGAPALWEGKGIRVEAFYLPHGPGGSIMNYGYLVTVGDVSFFHTGDADLESFSPGVFMAYGLARRDIDLAFVPHFYLLGDPEDRRFVEEGIAARYILTTHYFLSNPRFDAAKVQANFPAAVLFSESLEEWTIP